MHTLRSTCQERNLIPTKASHFGCTVITTEKLVGKRAPSVPVPNGKELFPATMAASALVQTAASKCTKANHVLALEVSTNMVKIVDRTDVCGLKNSCITEGDSAAQAARLGQYLLLRHW